MEEAVHGQSGRYCRRSHQSTPRVSHTADRRIAPDVLCTLDSTESDLIADPEHERSSVTIGPSKSQFSTWLAICPLGHQVGRPLLHSICHANTLDKGIQVSMHASIFAGNALRRRYHLWKKETGSDHALLKYSMKCTPSMQTGTT